MMARSVSIFPHDLDAKYLTTMKNKIESETSQLLKKLKSIIGVPLWFTLYPKSDATSCSYDLPKIHKPGIPLRSIVGFTNTPTYALFKYLSNLLKPLLKNLHNAVKDTYDACRIFHFPEHH